MKGKGNEAMAAGVPVVTTSFGVAGVQAAVEDRPDDFADAIVRLLKGPAAARAMGAAGQEVARNFSPERVAQLLEAMLAELVPHPRALGPQLRWLASNERIGFRLMSKFAVHSGAGKGGVS